MAFDSHPPTMAAPTRARVEQHWRALAQRNQWFLIDDVDAWIDYVTARLPESVAPSDREINSALHRAYGARLYRGLMCREDRAAMELSRALWRLAFRERFQRSEAEDLAQETVTRVIEKLPDLRDPESLLSWAFMIFRTVVRDLRPKLNRSDTSLDDIDTLFEDIVDLTETPAHSVEQAVITEQLVDLLKDKVPDDFSRLVILRLMFGDDVPRDIARDLGLPLHRVRLVKSRILQRLRTDDDFKRLLDEIGDRV